MKGTFNIQRRASNRQRRPARAPGYSILPVRRWWFVLLFCACLDEGFVAHLSATEPLPDSSGLAEAPAQTAPRVFAESDLQELLTSVLQQDYVKDKGRLELRFMQPWSVRRTVQGPVTLKILDLPNAGVTASFIVRFELLETNRSLGAWQLPVQARVMREVWVARSALKRGELVSEAEIAREPRDLLTLREPLADFTELDPNLELAEPLQAGSPLLARSVKPRPVVHRGQSVQALVESGALSVTIKVEALEDGAVGQTVRARNPNSLRNLRGKVLDEQTILVSM